MAMTPHVVNFSHLLTAVDECFFNVCSDSKQMCVYMCVLAIELRARQGHRAIFLVVLWDFTDMKLNDFFVIESIVSSDTSNKIFINRLFKRYSKKYLILSETQ